MLVRGSMTAESKDAVLAHLRTRALFITSIAAESSVAGKLSALSSPRGRRGSQTGFLRSLAVLFRAGIPIARAIRITIDQTPDRGLREALEFVLAELEAGRSLSYAMAQRPNDFSRMHVTMIAAGEIGGKLDEVLERLASLSEADRVLRGKLANVLAYPAIVTLAATVLAGFLIVTIVPQFAALYAQMNVPLPLSTQVLLSIGKTLAAPYAPVVALAFAVSVAAIVRASARSAEVRAAIERATLRAPAIGSLLRKQITARIARLLGSLLGSGVEIVSAIDVVARTTESSTYRASLARLAADIREGAAVSSRFAAEPRLYDPIVAHLVAIGDETGSLDTMLLKIAEYYEFDVATAANTLSTVLEPAVTIVVGSVVGAIVFSIYIPLYTMIGKIH
jgi:type IV pilus assembly protein PilC